MANGRFSRYSGCRVQCNTQRSHCLTCSGAEGGQVLSLGGGRPRPSGCRLLFGGCCQAMRGTQCGAHIMGRGWGCQSSPCVAWQGWQRARVWQQRPARWRTLAAARTLTRPRSAGALAAPAPRQLPLQAPFLLACSPSLAHTLPSFGLCWWPPKTQAATEEPFCQCPCFPAAQCPTHSPGQHPAAVPGLSQQAQGAPGGGSDAK